MAGLTYRWSPGEHEKFERVRACFDVATSARRPEKRQDDKPAKAAMIEILLAYAMDQVLASEDVTKSCDLAVQLGLRQYRPTAESHKPRPVKVQPFAVADPRVPLCTYLNVQPGDLPVVVRDAFLADAKRIVPRRRAEVRGLRFSEHHETGETGGITPGDVVRVVGFDERSKVARVTELGRRAVRRVHAFDLEPF